jgi:GDP-D-mannose dehydratase
MEFEELKQDVLGRAKKANACKDEYKRAYLAASRENLLQVIVDNIIWTYRVGMLDTSYMMEHFEDLFTSFNIYTTQAGRVDNASVVLLGTASVEAYGSSTVEACDSSTVRAYGSSTVRAYDSSTVEAYDESYIENRTNRKILPSSDYAIVKAYYEHRLYVKRGKFEIIEVE